MAHRELVLLRHGRTAWNASGRMQGHADVPLDDVGHRQAAAAAAALAGMTPAALWSSDLARACGTAAYLATATGLAVTTDERLREFDVGVRVGMTQDEFATAHPAAYDAWHAGAEHPVVAGAETAGAVRERVVPALLELLAAVPEGEVGVAVMHGAAARVAVAALLGWPADVVTTLRGLDNGGWAVLEQDTAVADGRLRLVAWNRQVPTPIS